MLPKASPLAPGHRAAHHLTDAGDGQVVTVTGHRMAEKYSAGKVVTLVAGFEEPLQSAGDPESVFLEVTPQVTHWRAKSEGVGATSWRESQILAHPPTLNGCRSLVFRPEADSDWLSRRGEAIAPGGAAEGEMGPGQEVVRLGSRSNDLRCRGGSVMKSGAADCLRIAGDV